MSLFYRFFTVQVNFTFITKIFTWKKKTAEQTGDCVWRTQWVDSCWLKLKKEMTCNHIIQTRRIWCTGVTTLVAATDLFPMLKDQIICSRAHRNTWDNSFKASQSYFPCPFFHLISPHHLSSSHTKKETNLNTFEQTMASCSMASAASGFVVTPNVATSNTASASRTSMLFFSSKSNINARTSSGRFVIRAAEEGAAPPAAATKAPEAKPKPPPIGPKRGTKVSFTVLRSYMFSTMLKLLELGSCLT